MSEQVDPRLRAGSAEAAAEIGRLRLDLALGGMRQQIVGNLANLAVAWLLVGDVLDPGRRRLWAGTVIATLVARLALVPWLKRCRADPARVGRALAALAACSVLTGMAWGALALMVPPFNAFAEGPYLVALFAGITAGAAAVNATHLPIAAAFVLPALAGTSWRFFAPLEPAGMAMGALVALYAVLLLAAARRFESTFLRAHLLRLEGERLSKLLRAEKERAEEASRASSLAEARLRALADHAPIGIVRFDQNGRVVYANTALEEIWGCGTDPAQLRRMREELVAASARDHPDHIHIGTPRGRRWLSIRRVTLPTGGAGAGDLILWVQDVTELTDTLSRLEHLAHHDPLTGVANRTRLRDRLGRAVASASAGQPCALAVIDLDDFKTINDTLGHGAGDTVLIEVARRLTASVRENDLVARLGGDEFAILFENVGDATSAAELGARLAAAFAEPVRLEERYRHIRASIGLALCPEHAADASGLVRCADAACYRAKEREGTRFCVFEPGWTQARESSGRPTELARRAIEEGSLELRLRPLLQRKDGTPAGVLVEARLPRSSARRRQGEDLWSLVERSALARPFFACLLGAAAAVVAAAPPLRLWLRAPAPVLRQSDFAEFALREMERAGVDPHRLQLLLDGNTLADLTASSGSLDRLRSAGVAFALAGFGGPGIALARLPELAADTLVLAPSLYRKAGAEAEVLLARTAAFAHELAPRVAAIEVESPAECDRLERVGCDLLAGEAVAPTTDPRALAQLLSAHGRQTVASATASG